jgi:asparagine synthase (glutamine-hydrolysing)
VWFGHRRLKIIDLSDGGRQPMATPDGRYQLIYNGEIYNYLELRSRLEPEYTFRSTSDSEVLLAAFVKWGAGCLTHLRGMFAFAIWDTVTSELFVARDRFGVKPAYWHATTSGVVVASEIKALHAYGVAKAPDSTTWASYLAAGLYDHGEATFWSGISSLPAGHMLTWSADAGVQITRWYDPADVIADGFDTRPLATVVDELEAMVSEVIGLRFRSDVPVGLCLSGGLDSSLLLAMTRRLYGLDAPIHTFTFFTGDANYDELPWVDAALRGGGQISHKLQLTPDEIPDLARRVQTSQDEPFGGFPTLGMAKVHEHARSLGITVLLDGNGMDEGWAGYDYYSRAREIDASLGPVQGSRDRGVGTDCLREDFRIQARPLARRSFGDPIFDLQYRDLTMAKIPRAMRFADRVSMMFSRELREPLLDHRLVELGLRQPPDRKVRDGVGKWLVRETAKRVLPGDLSAAPKRPVQTPQREWLRGTLAGWAKREIEVALVGWGKDWLIADQVRAAWTQFESGAWDTSFPIWQWISLGMLSA